MVAQHQAPKRPSNKSPSTSEGCSSQHRGIVYYYPCVFNMHHRVSKLMKAAFPLLIFCLLIVPSCIVPGRFAGSNAPLPAGVTGADLGYIHSVSLDTTDFQVSSFSIGGQIQEHSGKLNVNFGLVNIFSPYAGMDYRFLDWGKSSWRTGFNFGMMDGILSIPLKSNFALSERFNVELNLRYAGSLYKRDYERLLSRERTFLSFHKSSLAPWYLGLDGGLNVKFSKSSSIGLRLGHYWYKNALDQKVDRILLFGINVMLSNQAPLFPFSRRF